MFIYQTVNVPMLKSSVFGVLKEIIFWLIFIGLVIPEFCIAQNSCTPKFTLSTKTVCSSDTLSITNQSTGSNLAYKWTFKDNNGNKIKTRSNKSPSVTFNNPGSSQLNYSVQLVITNASGCDDTLTKNFTLKPQPTAVFSMDSSRFCKSGTVNFTDASKGNGLSYQWDFGVASKTGDTAVVANPSYKYKDTGVYKPTLTVTNGQGCDDQATKKVVVGNPPVADFKVRNNCKKQSTKFTDISQTFSDSVAKWDWDFGDNSGSSLKNPNHQYSSKSTFNVSLKITLAGGCVDSTSDNVKIHSTPSASIGDTGICENNNVSFTGSKPSSASSFKWKFGDGKVESNNINPFHVYAQSGAYQPSLAVTFPDNRTCEVPTDSLEVFGNSAINATITTADTQCSKGNQVCLVDSTPASSNVTITNRTVLYGDGAKSQDSGSNVRKFCHSYSQSNNTYSVQLTVKSQSGCKASKNFNSAIFVRKPWTASFSTQYQTQCFGTPVTFTNQTGLDSSNASSFKWDFDNGETDTTRWTGFTKTYNKNGAFSPSLTVTSKYGCTRSFELSKGAENVSFNFNITASADTLCFGGKKLELSQPPIKNANFTWFYGDGDSQNQNVTGWTTTHEYPNPGQYTYKLKVSNGNCDSTSPLDTVNIIGVNPNFSIKDSFEFMCGVPDSVVFVDSALNPEQSIHYGVPNTQRIWDFGDTLAPSCTTNTAKGKNVNKNCRYSRDSVSVAHSYPKNQPDCYEATITFDDTVSGCKSSKTTEIALQKPEAGPDSSHSPPLPGAKFISDNECLGPESRKSVEVNLDSIQPQCGPENYWVMWDSTCAEKSGNFSAQWENAPVSHTYGYDDQPCESDGTRTIGLVVQNGTDSNGNLCKDTAWYTDEIQQASVDPRITSDFKPSADRCPPVNVTFSLKDSLNQDSVSSYTWKIDDDTFVRNNPSPISYKFKKHKEYEVSVKIRQFRLEDSCIATPTSRSDGFIELGVGFRGGFRAKKTRVCKGESVTLRDSVKYWDTTRINSNFTIDFWGQSSRRNAGKETLKWDYGDGQGFKGPSHDPVNSYDTIGEYDVSLAIKDSSGCRDTITKKDLIRVYGVNASFGSKPRELICTPDAQFFDSSTLVDSGTSFPGHPNDTVVKWEWQFGDGKPKSFVRNPAHNYTTNDTFDVKMEVESNQGCKDSITKGYTIPGPAPSFSIVGGDTLGCKPHTALFNNNSKSSTSYVWEFGDPNNNVISTRADTNVDFTYKKAGEYAVYLVGRDSVTNPLTNTKEFCSATFPDTTLQDKKIVKVRGQPTSSFTAITSCNKQVSFQEDAKSTPTSSITKYKWQFDTQGSSTQADTNFTFSKPGNYTVDLIVTNKAGCKDTASQQVSIPFIPNAKFKAKNACVGQSINFQDQSMVKKDSIQKWKWKFGDGDTSSAENPSHSYSIAGNYTVQLTVTSFSGCKDTVSQTLNIPGKPSVAYTINRKCSNQDLNLQNNTTSDSGSLSYQWEFGDGTTASTAMPSKTYSSSGNYQVELVADVKYTTLTCTDSLSKNVTIDPTPNSQYSVSNTCLNKTVNFTNQSTIPSGSISSYQWSFDDGGSSSQKSPDYQYANDGSYKPELIATSAEGCEDTAQQSLQVHPVPQASFTANNACENDTINLQNNTTLKQGTLTYDWAFGDGTTSTKTSPDKAYSSDGNYQIEEIATSGKGCKDTANQSITVNPRSSPSFSFSDDCEKDTVSFTNNTTGPGGLSYDWEFGDGSSSTSANPQKVYSTDGNYQVKLISTTPSNCKDSLTKTIAIFPNPDPGYTVTNNCVDAAVSFQNNTTVDSGSLSYQWQFGDGNSSTVANPSNTYTSYKFFNVSLTANTNEGCSADTTGSIRPFPLPTATYTVQDTCEQQPHFFQNNSSIANGSVSYQWDFDDGSQSTSTSPMHQYASQGTYQPQLTATSNKGCIDSVTQSVEAFNKPIAQFGFTNKCQPQAIPFRDQSVTSSGNAIQAFNWDFGDGNSSSKENPDYTYNKFGTYNVTLVVTNNRSCKDTTQQKVNSYAKPTADFTAPVVCETQATPFQDQSSIASGGITTWSWEFNAPGGTSSRVNPSFTYPDGGSYQPQLIITSNENCRDTISKVVTVNPIPEPGFTVNDTCFNQPTSFEDTSSIQSGSIANREWVLGDGTTVSNQTTFTYTYPGPKTYQSKLKAISIKGCIDSVSKPTRVQFLPQADFSSDTVCSNKPTTFTDSSAVKKSSIVSWEWKFGDGSQSSIANPQHIYRKGGQYPTRLVVRSSKGCLDTNRQNTQVYFKPEAGFAVDSICFPDTSSFTDTSVVTNSSFQQWSWDFGDGSSANVQNPDYAYDTFGSYEVKLVATTLQGCKDTARDTVRVNPKPVSDFAFEDTCQPNPVNFRDQSQVDTGRLVAYKWQFGEGDTSTKPSPVHPYDTFGRFEASLAVRTEKNCRDTAIQTVEVFPKPVAGFTVDNVCRIDTAIFQETSSVAGNSSLQDWDWQLGDSTSANGDSLSYTYAVADTYDVEMIVTTTDGCKDTVVNPLTIYPMPQSRFITNDSLQCLESENFSFTNETTIKWGSSSYNWRSFRLIDSSLSDQATSLDYQRQFRDTGDYKVELKAISNFNCSTRDSQVVKVYPDPQATFTVNNGCINDPLKLLDRSQVGKGVVDSWLWKPGNGNLKIQQDPQASYDTGGIYPIQLVATTNAGCDDTAQQNNRIYGKPEPATMRRVTVKEDSFARIEWEPSPSPNPGFYEIYRSNTSPTTSGSPLGTFQPNNTVVRDFNVMVDSQDYYYTLNFVDSCGIPYPFNNFGRTIHLDVETDVRFPELSFNSYEGWPRGVKDYQVQWSSNRTVGFEPVKAVDTNEFKDSLTRGFGNPYCYRIVARKADSTSVISVSNVSCVNSDSKIYIPEAFSPNDDNHNDLFRPKGSFVLDYNIKIFNRWGEKIFESNDRQKAWDGKYKGEEAPTGIYQYQVIVQGTEDVISKSGTVTLIR